MKTHEVFIVMTGRLFISRQLEDRQNYPFGDDEYNKFFDNFLDMSFEFEEFGSVFIYDAKENAPSHSYAVGWFFAEYPDELTAYVKKNGVYPKPLGEIRFEYGGGLDPRITVKKI